MTAVQHYNELLARKLAGEFAARNMEGHYCPTKEEALQKVLELVPEGSVVSYGGSLTLQEIGARKAFGEGNYHFLDPNAVSGAKEKERVAREALQADYFLMSANAIAQTGELVNADGIGNRVAALCFGPQNVIVIAGMNKVVPTLEAAITRVKTTASQMCMAQYRQDYASFDALEEASSGIISQLVVTSMTAIKGRIKVILVGEALGL